MLAVYFWRKGLLVIRTPHICMRELIMIWRLLSISLEHLRNFLKLWHGYNLRYFNVSALLALYLLALEVPWRPGNISLRLSNSFRY